MESISTGLNANYIFKHQKFSSKAAYTQTQIQDQSAGSFTLGFFINYDEVNSPNGFIPSEIPDSLATDFSIRSFRYFATGFSIGYMYTWVLSRHFFLHGSLIPGLGYKNIRLSDNEGISESENQPHVQLQLRAGLGYEHRFFYMGIYGFSLVRNIRYKSYDIDLATEQIRFYIGKRF
jgi:hypothetical protein